MELLTLTNQEPIALFAPPPDDLVLPSAAVTVCASRMKAVWGRGDLLTRLSWPEWFTRPGANWRAANGRAYGTQTFFAFLSAEPTVNRRLKAHGVDFIGGVVGATVQEVRNCATPGRKTEIRFGQAHPSDR